MGPPPPEGAGWVDATFIGVATGAALMLLGLLTLLVVVAGALRAEVRRRGLAPTVRTSPADDDAAVSGDDDHQNPPQPGDLDAILASLAAALLEDVRDGHQEREPNTIRAHRAATFPTAQHRNT